MLRVMVRRVVCAAALLGVAVTHTLDAIDRAAPALPTSVRIVRVASEAQLESAVRALRSGTTLVLEPGTYHLRGPLTIGGPLRAVQLRGVTGRRSDVVLVGGPPGAGEPRATSALVTRGLVEGLTIANLTIRDFSGNGVELTAGSSRVRLHNVHMVDAGRTFLSAARSAAGLIEFSAFELTDGDRSAPSRAIQVSSGANWTVRHSRFRNFRTSDERNAVPAVGFQNRSSATDISANRFVNCQQEVAVGSRAVGLADHSGGLVRNNFVVRESWVGGGPAVMVASSRPTMVLHNSILLNGSAAFAIEIAADSTDGVRVQNNLMDGEVRVSGDATAIVTPNETRATPAFFVDPAEGDLHLLESATTVIDAAPVLSTSATDWDGDARPSGSAADYGADERNARTVPATDGARTGGVVPTGSHPDAGDRTPGSIAAGIAAALDAGTVLPSPWLGTDIGSSSQSGSELYSSGAFIVTAAGSDIAGSADEFRFIHRPMTGDGVITARVAYVGETSKWARAGIMIRKSLHPESAHASLLASASHGLSFHRRLTDQGLSSATGGAAASVPHWVRLVRSGAEISAHHSTDGVRWTRVGSAAVAMPRTIHVGLAVTSRTASRTATAVISDVRLTTPATSLPAPWRSGDIGTPAIGGAATYSSGTFAVTGAGADIWSRSDQFRYLYQTLSGDGEVVARVSALQHTHAWAKAGVMIRETLAPESRHAYALLSAGAGFALQHRRDAGGGTASTAAFTGASPGWVRLVRRGTQFTAYRSIDGVNWSLMGVATIPMPSTVYAGVAVTSHDAARATTALVTDVGVRAGVVNAPPTVMLTSPHAEQTFTAPASVALAATAADVDGAIVRVDFYSGSTLLGSDTTSPYTLVWTNVASGTYSLTAVAQDAAGARTRSAPVTSTVTSATLVPQTLSFAASSDHAIVTEYVLELFRSGMDSTSEAPLRWQSLGKPAVVNGRITLDVARAIEALGSGTYFATVSSVNAAGHARSRPSNTFTR